MKLAIWEKVFEEDLPNFENIIKNMHIEGSGEAEFRKFWVQGVPEKIRGKVWAKATGNPNYITPKLFEILCRRGKKVKAEIDRKQAESENQSLDVSNQSVGKAIQGKEDKSKVRYFKLKF